MKKRNRKLVALLLALAMLLSMASCGTSSGDSADSPANTSQPNAATQPDSNDVSAVTGTAVYGGSINISYQAMMINTDPSAGDSYKWQLWNERLFQIDLTKGADHFQSETTSAANMCGQLADTWAWDPDAQTFTITLKDGVCFQDKSAVGMGDYDVFGGRALTAADVKYTYDRLIGLDTFSEPYPCEENWPSSLYMVESIEAPDDKTVVFHFNTNAEIASTDFMLVNVNITGPEWDALTDAQRADWRYATGTGAYILTTYEPDSFATFTKSENYYGVDERAGYEGNKLPYLDSITMSIITENANQITQFVSGNLDLMGWNRAYLSDSELKLLEDSMDSADYTKYIYLGMPTSICYKLSANEPLQDLRVRQALQMAINADEINDAYYGFSTACQTGGMLSITTDFSSVDQWSDELKETWTYNPSRAKELLAEAGYPDGFSFKVAIHSGLDSDLYTLVSDYLAQIGVTMEIEVAADVNAMKTIGDDRNNPASIEGNWGIGALFFVYIAWRDGGPGYSAFHDDPNVEDFCVRLNAATSEAEKIQIAKEFDLYMSEQHYALVMGPYSQNPVYVSSKIGGMDSTFFYANLNMSTILNHCWDTTAA